MKSRFGQVAALCAVLASFGSGCGQDTPDDPDMGTSKGMDGGPREDGGGDEQPALLPWATGNTWTYRITDKDEAVSEKVTTIGEEEEIGGAGPHADEMAFRVETKKGAMDQTLSWQRAFDGKVVRMREQSFGAKTGLLELEEHWDPYKLHVDGSAEHLKAGATWVEEYQETKSPAKGSPVTATAHDRWTVISVSESVTVPAGTFDAIVLQKAGGSNLKTYWYMPGVGKVKETGGQTEELVSYKVAP
jgi:hypothetical protein